MITETKSPERIAEEKEEEQQDNLRHGHPMTVLLSNATYDRIVAIQRRSDRKLADLIRCWIRDGIYYFEKVEEKEQKRIKKYET